MESIQKEMEVAVSQANQVGADFLKDVTVKMVDAIFPSSKDLIHAEIEAREALFKDTWTKLVADLGKMVADAQSKVAVGKVSEAKEADHE